MDASGERIFYTPEELDGRVFYSVDELDKENNLDNNKGEVYRSDEEPEDPVLVYREAIHQLIGELLDRAPALAQVYADLYDGASREEAIDIILDIPRQHIASAKDALKVYYGLVKTVQAMTPNDIESFGNYIRQLYRIQCAIGEIETRLSTAKQEQAVLVPLVHYLVDLSAKAGESDSLADAANDFDPEVYVLRVQAVAGDVDKLIQDMNLTYGKLTELFTVVEGYLKQEIKDGKNTLLRPENREAVQQALQKMSISRNELNNRAARWASHECGIEIPQVKKSRSVERQRLTASAPIIKVPGVPSSRRVTRAMARSSGAVDNLRGHSCISTSAAAPVARPAGNPPAAAYSANLWHRGVDSRGAFSCTVSEDKKPDSDRTVPTERLQSPR